MNGLFILLFLFCLSPVTSEPYKWKVFQQNFYYHNKLRAVTTVNDQIPGPLIIANEGDRIEVEITNLLITQATTIHWHGMDQRGTPFMDGVPDIAECGTKPNGIFNYSFDAIPAGTHWYHSHSGAQYMDGHFGPMIIKSLNDPHKDLYDEDLAEHVVIFNDWFEEPGEELIVNLINGQFTGGPVSDIPWSMGMVNGYVGPLEGVPMSRQTLGFGQSFNPNDYAVFEVTKGKKYRFRMINGGSNMGFRFSIDGHDLNVISANGGYLRPQIQKSWVSFPGERFDFVLDASQPISNYWLRFENAHGASVRAILRYKGASATKPSPADDCPPESQCSRAARYLERANQVDTEGDFEGNCCSEGRWPEIDPCCQAGMGEFIPSIITGLHSVNTEPHSFPAGEASRTEKFTILGIMKPEFVLHLNSKIFAFPTTPLVFSKGEYGLIKEPYRSLAGQRSFLRNESYADLIDAMGELTVETHVKFVQLGDVVDIILNNHGPMIHPFHLHGHRFWILGTSRPLTEPIRHEDTSLDLYQEYDPEKHKSMLNMVDPPFADSVPVPDHGWAYIRYTADNPGSWIIHCHLDPHLAAGMSFAIVEGADKWPEFPPNFPTCGAASQGIGRVSDLRISRRTVTWGLPDFGYADYYLVIIKKGKTLLHRSQPTKEQSYEIPREVDISGARVILKAFNVFKKNSVRSIVVRE